MDTLMAPSRRNKMPLGSKIEDVTSSGVGTFSSGKAPVEFYLVIEPSKALSLGLKELWQHRELLFFLAWRDIKVRYSQSVLGVGWAILQPVFSMVVFTIIFGKVARVNSDGVPYAIFSYTALLPW